jgi:hypothetical protein
MSRSDDMPRWVARVGDTDRAEKGGRCQRRRAVPHASRFRARAAWKTTIGSSGPEEVYLLKTM